MTLKNAKTFLFRNTSTKQIVIKNTIWSFVSQIGGRLLKSVLIIYAARALGAAEYGVFSYALTLAAFMNTFMDPGVNAILMREIARSSEGERRKLISTTLVIKVVLVVVGAAIVIFIGPYFSKLPGASALLPLAGLILTLDTLREFFLSLVRGMEQMEWEAIISLFTNVGVVVFGFIYLLADRTAHSLAFGYAFGTGIGAIAAILLLRKYFAGVFKSFSARLIPTILRAAWPFAIIGALGLLLTNTDILIISWMTTASDVGVYSAAIRIIQVIYLLPSVFQATTLPLFSRLAGRGDKEFRNALEQTMCVLVLISLPMAIGGVILGVPIMTFFFGPAFVSGSLSFKILISTIVVAFPGAIGANAIFASGNQKSLIVSSAIGGVSNVLFDILFIPRWGIVGSAIATLLAQLLSNGHLFYVMKKLSDYELLPHIQRILVGSIVMGLVTILLASAHVHVILNVCVSAAVYLLMLRILREPILGNVKAVLSRPAVAEIS